MKEIRKHYYLKEGSVRLPERQLAANIDKVQTTNGVEAWSLTYVDYLKGAIENVNKTLKELRAALKSYGKDNRSFSSNYKPELDTIEELDEELLN